MADAEQDAPKRHKHVGAVFVGSMNMRGVWADTPKGATRVNVTSAQATASVLRQDFSPMTATGYKGFHCFENYWQSLKRYEGISEETSVAWWKSQTKGKRRYPAGKGKRVLHACVPVPRRPAAELRPLEEGGSPGQRKSRYLDYRTSRKEVYVPEYDALMRATPSFQNLRSRVEAGEDVVVMDFNGPRTPDRGVACDRVTVELLKRKIHDVATPFGHGYVVAAALAGIAVEDYAQ